MVKFGTVLLSLFRVFSRPRHQQLSTAAAARLQNFDPNHHVSIRKAYAEKLSAWSHQTEGEESRRCKRCWCFRENCFCKSIDKCIEELSALNQSKLSESPEVNLLLYYHNAELGRHCNTGHLIERFCQNRTSSLVFGDVEKENQLIEDIQRENVTNSPSTCILYPHNTSILLSEWLASRPNKTDPVRLVALDGTYINAHTQVRHLKHRCELVNCTLPVVRLDLENNACKSAVEEILHQPSESKICTFQALVLGMRQTGVNSDYCDQLMVGLDYWKEHILDCFSQSKGNY